MTDSGEAQRAIMRLPEWAWAGNPSALLHAADVRVRPGVEPGSWTAQTIENYQRRPPDLVSYKHIAGPSIAREDFDYLNDRAELADHDPGAHVAAELEERQARLQVSRNPVHAMELMRLQALVVDVASLGDIARRHWEDLREVPLEGDDLARVFGHAGVHLIERSTSLVWRCKIPMLLSQLAQDRRFLEGDIAHLAGANGSGELAFRSAGGLADGIYLMDAYLGPLLAALTPSVWAFAVPRSFGVLIYSLGQPMAGTTGSAEEMLQVIGGPGATRSVPVPRLSPAASHFAIRWWAEAVNRMFAVTSDFAIFTDRRGNYLPYEHMQTILTVEQLFRRAASAAVADRDTNARRVLAFTALDTVERLTSVKLEKMANPSYAAKVLERLRTSLPSAAGEVLLPAASRGVEALRDLESGFFVRELLGDEELRLHYADGRTAAMDTESATAFYVKALRDATHGHGSNKAAARDRTNALLAQHDGDIPHDLGLIATLYLLDLLDRPGRLSSVLRAWCRRS